jgi:uncharacterized protein GlcG (DUF336 family)
MHHRRKNRDLLTPNAASDNIAAAFAKAVGMKLKPLGVSVFDAGGQFVTFQPQDGASFLW